jgi:molybdopterin-synthase adenylyltransferase
MELNDDLRLRYSRHLLLNEFGESSQAALMAARVLIVGAGGLGSPAALYLASAGVGQLTLADDDHVDLTNLQRQIAHTQARVGMNKAQSAAVSVAGINPHVDVRICEQRLEGEALRAAIAEHDLVLDCSDNFPTRYAINAACVALAKPLVSGSAIRFDGQLAVFDSRKPDAPCYHCVFPEDWVSEPERCATLGVFAPLVGIVGTLQAQEAIKVLTGIGETCTGRLLMVSSLDCRFTEVRVRRDPGCNVCGVVTVACPHAMEGELC